MDQLFTSELEKLKDNHNFRSLKSQSGIDFSSNDYLGLANHPKIKEAICNALNNGTSVGSTGARLLRGNCKEHFELEEFAANFFDAPKTLFFSSGFLANYALLTTLPGRHDVIIFDELVHASARDGINASLAKKIKFKHNDFSELKKTIDKAQSISNKNIWIVAESVYSMDGDICDAKKLINLVNDYKNVYVIYDEAHSTGVFGQNGRGCCEGIGYEKLISVHTCGKALGVSGALVCASDNIIDYLINSARPFIFTTAESPIISVAVKEALKLIDSEPWRRDRLKKLVQLASDCCSKTFESQIIPIEIGDNEKALKAADYLQTKGFDVRAVRPPTVPSARLRLSLNINRSEAEIKELFDNLNLILPDLLL